MAATMKLSLTCVLLLSSGKSFSWLLGNLRFIHHVMSYAFLPRACSDLDQAGLAVVFGDAGDSGATCETIRCIQGGNITCANRPGEVIQACHCLCAPKYGKGCVLHLQSGSQENCTTKNC
jgi:hypothetical protein